MESPVMRVSLSPQFGRWQSQIEEAMVPSSGAQMTGHAMTKFLLEKGVDVNTRLVLVGEWTPSGIGEVSMSPLHVALTDGRVETAQLMIAHGADVRARDSIGRSPLTVHRFGRQRNIQMLVA